MNQTENQIQTVRQFQKVCEILEEYNRDSSKLIPILQKVQEEYSYLPKEVMTFIATSLEIPPSRIYGVATFYSHFALEPKGKYVVKVCDGTACHVKGSMKIVDAVKKHLNMREDQTTTEDMLFTVETVSCLGACGLAPAVVINEDVYGQQNGDSIVDVLKTIIEKEGE